MPRFNFPMPGRKSHKPNREIEKQTQHATKIPVSPTVSMSSGMSKAQRFFGTDSDLNIDSPTRDDDSWMASSSRSSVMSISISESTQLTAQTDEMGSVRGEDRWEMESDVLPGQPKLGTRASSTILGARYGDANYSVTDATIRLRNEDSSSTLKSFYDKHNSPLAISQQTSESSSRDLALRKGLPKIVPTSPLLHVQSVESMFLGSVNGEQSDNANGKNSKKKPAKLNLSLLFPSSGRRTSKAITDSASPLFTGNSINTNNGAIESTPNKLRKAYSKESMRSQRSTSSSRIVQPSPSNHNDTLQPLPQKYYNPSPVHRSPLPMDRIPEHLIPERRSLKPPQRPARPDVLDNSQSIPPRKAIIEHHDMDYTLPSRPWNESSAASVSSHNTRSSGRTANSALSNVDLQVKSVLSLSDSEDENDDLGDLLTPPRSSSISKVSRLLNGTIPGEDASHTENGDGYSHREGNGVVPRRLSTKMRKTLDQFPAIPERSIHRPNQPEPSNHRNHDTVDQSQSESQSGSYSVVGQSYDRYSRTSQHLVVPKDARHSMTLQKPAQRTSIITQKGHSRKSSQKSQRSIQQPTPPLSPSSMHFRVDPDDNGRFMAVTKQEEALLAALRMKRATMKGKSEPNSRATPRTAEEIKSARYSTVSTRDSMGPSKETVLMFLDTPITDAQKLYTAEPSPDLTDFLGFVSDEETTPRSSWKQSRTPGAPRPDSTISPNPRLDRLNTPSNSAARLSAVGVTEDSFDTTSARSMESRKKPNSVRFSEDAKAGSNDGSDDGVVWGL